MKKYHSGEMGGESEDEQRPEPFLPPDGVHEHPNLKENEEAKPGVAAQQPQVKIQNGTHRLWRAGPHPICRASRPMMSGLPSRMVERREGGGSPPNWMRQLA